MKRDQSEFKPEGASGQPDAPSAVRSERRDSERSDELDTSQTPQGFTKQTREIFSAMHQTTSLNPVVERQRGTGERERLRQKERDRLADWYAQMVLIGGVQMTNEEAQRARRRFIENEDYYAERAVRHGLIRDGEQGELKRTMRRRYELEDRTRRGVDTVEDHRELNDIKASRIGRAADDATADIHTNRRIGANADAKQAITREVATASAAPLPSARDIFQSTPVAQAAFAQAAQLAPDGMEPAPASPRDPREVKATGLEI